MAKYPFLRVKQVYLFLFFNLAIQNSFRFHSLFCFRFQLYFSSNIGKLPKCANNHLAKGKFHSANTLSKGSLFEM